MALLDDIQTKHVEWTGGQKLALIGVGTVVVIAGLLIAHASTKCIFARRRWAKARKTGKRDAAAMALYQGRRWDCPWAIRVARRGDAAAKVVR